jgi:hypothetical protein
MLDNLMEKNMTSNKLLRMVARPYLLLLKGAIRARRALGR